MSGTGNKFYCVGVDSGWSVVNCSNCSLRIIGVAQRFESVAA